MKEWNYCGDGNNMPENEGFYLISLKEEIHPQDDDLAIQICWYSEKLESFIEHAGRIDAWMPLPARYKKIRKEKEYESR